MTKQQSVPQFDCGHPLLDAAQAHLNEFLTACAEQGPVRDWVARQLTDLQPVQWTKRLEDAIGNDEQIQRLCTEYDERAITFSHAYLKDSGYGERVQKARSALYDTVGQLVAFHDSIARYSADEWLKPMFRAAIVVIHNVLQSETGRWDHLDTRGVLERGDKAMRTAFQYLVGVLSQTRRGSVYTTDLVVQGCKILPHLNRDVDLRNIWVIALNDNDGRYPKNGQLADLLTELDSTVKGLRDVRRQFGSDDNGSINEAQYASRLLSMARGETCGKLDKQVVAAQDERRIRYETAFRRMQVLLAQATKLRQLVADALLDAVEEIKVTGAHTGTPRMAINHGVIWLEQRVINNILAADLALRYSGRIIDEHKRGLADKSFNAGARAVEHQFEDIAKRFRPGIERRTQGAAGQQS